MTGLMGARAGAGMSKGRGILRRIISAVYKPALEREREFYEGLRELSAGIEVAPECMTRRVLRGEMYLERGEAGRARQDFEDALKLAERMDGATGWLIVEQAMRDRALHGISMIESAASGQARTSRVGDVEA